jgi:CubicO group peptidase (beta-lactamase class C family)
MTQVRPADPIGAALRRLREPGFAHVGHLVVVRDGDAVAARALDEPADVFSVTKSVLATVTLLAVRDGLVSLDATLGELLGKRVPLGRRDATVRHLLSMTGGAHCGGLEDIDRVMEQPGSWVDALLAVPGRLRTVRSSATTTAPRTCSPRPCGRRQATSPSWRPPPCSTRWV